MKKLSDLRKGAINREKAAYLLAKSKPLYMVCEYDNKKQVDSRYK
jgi:hypothetical protein